MMRRRIVVFAAMLLMLSGPACAGPPYVTDDPQTTDYSHFEIYLFDAGTATRAATSSATGIDFNYGAGPNLQLTVVAPLAFETAPGGGTTAGLGNVELAAKYHFLRQDNSGWDVAFFPRVFLPAGSPALGARNTSLLLPIWLEKDFGAWSSFGGGGCVINRGGDAQNSCLMGWAFTKQILPNLQIGAELYHQTADTIGGRATTGIGAGVIYDLSDHYHLMASFGPGIQNAIDTNQYSWYTALLFTF